MYSFYLYLQKKKEEEEANIAYVVFLVIKNKIKIIMIFN